MSWLFPLFSLLQPGQCLVQQTFFVGHEPGLWIGGEYSSFQNDGRIFRLLARLDARFGVRDDLELGVNVDYERARMAAGDDAGRRDGDTVAGISEVGFRIQKRLFPFAVARLGYRNSGENTLPADDLLAVNDGSAKFDFGGRFEAPWFFADFSYVYRADPLSDRLELTLEAPFRDLFSGFTVGPRVDYIHTLHGFDIASDTWVAFLTSKGRNPFSLVQEQYLLAGIESSFTISEDWWLTSALGFRLWGRNTNKSIEGRVGISALL